MEVRDMGAHTYNKADEYPKISAELGRIVSSDELNMGVLLCGSGVGASAAVNKIKGIRGAVGINGKQIQAGRHDDDMNVLIIAADYTGVTEAQEMISAFLDTPFDGDQERYRRRILEIKALESE